MQQVGKHSGVTFAVSHPRDVVLSQGISDSLQVLEMSFSWYIQCKWVTLLHLSLELDLWYDLCQTPLLQLQVSQDLHV